MLTNRSPGANLRPWWVRRPFVFRLTARLRAIATGRSAARRGLLIPLTARMILSDKSATSVDGFEKGPFMNETTLQHRLTGTEHWTTKGEVKLFLWNKCAGDPAKARGTVLFVHGSSMASQPTFDLDVPGRPDSSAMEFFARHGYDTWSVDMEGYGRSTKTRDNNAPIAYGAEDCAAAAKYIQGLRGKRSLLVYGISSGALRAALFAQNHPELVGRLALDATVWTGKGSRTLADRAKKLPEFRAKNRRPIDRAFVHSIFNRDHPGSAEDKVIEAFADAILALDDSIPNGTYVDMCSNLPVCDPTKITVPTVIMRGQWDGIASFDDLIEFFKLLPNPDKQFAVMPGISHASFQGKNYEIALHILLAFFTQPAPVYTG
jgi:pimeloyl-ACP methyl ester carboxylesterase